MTLNPGTVLHGFACAVTALLLAGCGGGGGDGGTAPSVTVSGTAVAGLPIIGGTTQMVCASGTFFGAAQAPGTAVATGAAGDFTVTAPGNAPCVIRVTGGTNNIGIPLLSVVTSSTQTSANVNQLTHMLATLLAGGNPDTLLFQSPGSISSRITPTAVATHRATIMPVIASLATAVGGNAASVDFLTGTFTANHDGFDQLLDNVTFTFVPSTGTASIVLRPTGQTLLTVNATTGVASTPFSTVITTSTCLIDLAPAPDTTACTPIVPVVPSVAGFEVRTAALAGANETPAVTTLAMGKGAVVVDRTTKAISGGITFTGLTPTAAHIHQGAVGVAGAIIVPLTLIGTDTAVIPAGTTLTDAQYTAFLAGELYFNAHSAANPNGEIRGQITGQGVAGLATLNGAQETPPVTTPVSGLGTLVVDPATREIMIGLVTFGPVTGGATAAHIHEAATGVAGAIIVPLTLGTNIATAAPGVILTVAQFSSLLAGNLYFNVHGTANPNGEIRGQIQVP